MPRACTIYPRLTKKPAPANQLTLSGNIEAHESLVSFKVPGRIVELPVEEGQQVEQGALLARLEDADFKQQVRIDEATVRVRESNLALTLAGTREQEVKAAQQAMIDAEADLEEKKLDNERAQQLFAKDEVSAQDRDLAATALKRAEAIFKAAQQRYNEAVEGSRKEDIAIARANLNEADANLGLSRIEPELHHSARAFERRDHRAPGGDWAKWLRPALRWSRSPTSITSGCAPISPRPTWARIHWGQDATITTDTYPGKQYHGRISFISSDAEFTPKSVQTYKERVTLVYRIKIDIDNPNHELKPGMPADAHI